MKYICLGYMEEKKWETMSESERNAMIDECFAYDDVLRKNGHFAGGEALQSAQNATTLRWKNGRVVAFWALWSASDRKSTRLNSSHVSISYAVFCLKKKIRR